MVAEMGVVKIILCLTVRNTALVNRYSDDCLSISNGNLLNSMQALRVIYETCFII